MLEHWVSTSRVLAHWNTVMSVCWGAEHRYGGANGAECWKGHELGSIFGWDDTREFCWTKRRTTETSCPRPTCQYCQVPTRQLALTYRSSSLS